MNIGIDIRSLMSPTRTGVGEYTHELVSAIFKIDRENQYFLFYNSYSDISKNIPQWKQDNVHYVSTRWPNKLLNSSLLFLKMPLIDKIIAKKSEDYRLQTTDEDFSNQTSDFSTTDDCRSPKSVVRSLDWFFSPNPNFTALSKKTKFILTIHDLSFEIYPEFFSKKQLLWHKFVNPGKQCRRADLILTPSENTKRDIIDFYKISPEKIRVIYPGLSSPLFKEGTGGGRVTPPYPPLKRGGDVRQKYNLPDKFILFLGTVEHRKNVIGIIEAFEKCYSTLPCPYSLVIAGSPGYGYKQILARQQKSPIKDKIKFIGYVDAEDKSALYSLANLFVYPSFYEGFGFPVLEAMASGTPVITSNRSSLPEATNGAAYLINPNNTADISNAIVQLIKNEKLREYYKIKGYEQATKFTWQSAARECLRFLQSV